MRTEGKEKLKREERERKGKELPENTGKMKQVRQSEDEGWGNRHIKDKQGIEETEQDRLTSGK